APYAGRDLPRRDVDPPEPVRDGASASIGRHRVRVRPAGGRPWRGSLALRRDLAVVDALLVARLVAQALLAGLYGALRLDGRRGGGRRFLGMAAGRQQNG